jgi:hypothetical protein
MQSNFKSIIRQTKNPVMLSGHNHSNSDARYTDGTPAFTDHTISAFYQKWLIVALVREHQGIIEVRKVQLQ